MSWSTEIIWLFFNRGATPALYQSPQLNITENTHMKHTLLNLGLTALLATATYAEVAQPSIFSDHMVLQREHNNPIWGTADAGEVVTVSINGQSHETKADVDGKWRLELDPMPAGGPFEMTVSGENTLTYSDVLVGEVWMCSGQSNMQWSVSNSNNADVEIASANHPEIRLLTIPLVGRQEPQENFNGEWTVCSPESIGNFSAVGYFFGRRLHDALEVPIGLIDNAWGGSSAEAWIPTELLEADEMFVERAKALQAEAEAYTDEIHAEKMAEYKAWIDAGKPGDNRRAPRDPRWNQHRPGNIYNGMLYSTIGYGMRGVIWYQGESNAGRADQYTELMSKVITNWRDVWGQGDFPFYWVQLADFREETDTPQDSGWAYLREAQTDTLDVLENVGQAVIIDVGEGRDIHPRNKQTVANRLARHALAKDYGYDNIASDSPRYSEMSVEDGAIIITFDHIDEGLYSFDTKDVIGFTIAGEDKQFVNAEAKIIGKSQIKVWSDSIESPVAVRYAWANNPVCNLYDRNGLPVTPFRTDR